MKAVILEKKRTVMEAPDSHFNYFAWPTVTRLKNGRLALGASGWRLDHVCPFGKAALSFSDDEGETWSLPAVALDTPLDDRDVGLCPFGEDGLILTSFNNTRAMQRERHPDRAFNLAYLDTVTDEEEERFLGSTFRVSFNNGAAFGPIRRAPVTSPHGPTALRDGAVLWVGRPFGTGRESDPVRAYEIPPAGEAILRGEIPHSGEGHLDCEPHAVELPDGRLLCQIRVQRAGRRPGDPMLTVYQSVSGDGGRTW